MGMATVYDPTKESFDPDKAEMGQAFSCEWSFGDFRHPYIRFVCMYQDDPIFEYWDYNRYQNGKPKGGVSQNFSIFATSGLYRDPENDA